MNKTKQKRPIKQTKKNARIVKREKRTEKKNRQT
jgi:hypothetical protein